MTLKILCKLSTETKHYSSHTILQNQLTDEATALAFDGDSLTTAQQRLAVLDVTARRNVPTTNAADPAVVDNLTLVAERRHTRPTRPSVVNGLSTPGVVQGRLQWAEVSVRDVRGRLR